MRVLRVAGEQSGHPGCCERLGLGPPESCRWCRCVAGSSSLSLLPPVSQRVFPYISVMVNNGSLSYDHERDGRPTELGGCTAIVRNLHYDTFLVIRYVKRHLTVSPCGTRAPGCLPPTPRPALLSSSFCPRS